MEGTNLGLTCHRGPRPIDSGSATRGAARCKRVCGHVFDIAPVDPQTAQPIRSDAPGSGGSVSSKSASGSSVLDGAPSSARTPSILSNSTNLTATAQVNRVGPMIANVSLVTIWVGCRPQRRRPSGDVRSAESEGRRGAHAGQLGQLDRPLGTTRVHRGGLRGLRPRRSDVRSLRRRRPCALRR